MSGTVVTTHMNKMAERLTETEVERRRLGSLGRKDVGSALDALLPSLAQEIAQEILPLDAILKNHGVSADEWTDIQSRPEFHKMLATAMVEWTKADSTTKRIRLKAAIAVEASIPHMFQLAVDPTAGDTGRTKAMELLAKMAGVATEPQQAAGGKGGFSISITMQNGNRVKVIDQNGSAVDSSNGGNQTMTVDVTPLQTPGFLLGDPVPDDSE